MGLKTGRALKIAEKKIEDAPINKPEQYLTIRFSDDNLKGKVKLRLKKLAHKSNMTLNELMNEIITKALEANDV